MTLFEIFYSLLMILIFIMIGTSLVYEKRVGISPTPVLLHVRKKAMGLIPSSFDSTGHYNIADLGCGWGGFLMALSQRFSSSRITGYEVSPWPYWVSKSRAFLFAKNVSVLNENFLEKDMSPFDVVLCYLSPRHMEQLGPMFSELKAGTVVISCSFPIKGWDAERTEYARGLFVTIPIFLYIIK